MFYTNKHKLATVNINKTVKKKLSFFAYKTAFLNQSEDLRMLRMMMITSLDEG